MYQNQRLIEYLRTHESISVAEAPGVIGVDCLTKRVSECRRAGHNKVSRGGCPHIQSAGFFDTNGV